MSSTTSPTRDSTLRLHRLTALARLIRYQSLAMTTAAGSGHPTSSLSAADLMTALWFDGWFRRDPARPDHPNNDRLIFSKGHASPLYYALWFAAGELSEDDLRGYRQFNSPLEGHPTAAFRRVDAATGSLGQGLSIGFGYALNARYLDKLPYRTYVLLGDSEMAEGSQWEAAALAAHYRLGNLVGILDVNRLGQRGETMLGHDIAVYARRFEAFGWRTLCVDGHSFSSILAAYAQMDAAPDRPTMIIAQTIKGKGVKFLEDQDGWHGRALDQDAFERAVRDLGDVPFDLRGQLAAPEDIAPPQVEPQAAPPLHYEAGSRVATRKAYGNALQRLYPRFPEMVVLDAEVSNSTKAEAFKQAQSDRFFEMFIAEQNMVGAATALARCGRIPFVSTFAAFLTRAFDQIRMIPHSDANVKIVGSHAGVSIGQDGPSQMGLEDIALFRAVPGSVVLHPCDAIATEKLVEAAARHRGLVYLRTLRQSTPVIYRESDGFTIGGSYTLRQHPQDVATIVAAGATVHEALVAADRLAAQGQPVAVIDLYSIKPVDQVALAEAASRTRLIVTVEDHYAAGGLGEAVQAALAPLPVPVFSLAVGARPRSGNPEALRDFAGISANAIFETLQKALGLTRSKGPTRSSEGSPPARAPEPAASPSAPASRGDNPLRRVGEMGQSVWLDFISRQVLQDGTLRRLIRDDGLSGVTSNPAIFDQAITRSNDYDAGIRAAAEETEDVERIFERLAIADIRAAADELQPVFLATKGRDGFVSLEVSPRLAGDTAASIERGRALWRAVDRPNVLIKIPGTRAGLRAIRQLLADGINVNVTLLFSLARYREVIDAFLAGAEECLERRTGRGAGNFASVASFFLSRIDTQVDRQLDEIARRGNHGSSLARRLRGTTAIASARLAHQIHRESFGGERFRRLRERGIRPQRLLWASTSTKDPAYSDVKYVEALIGPDTISTMPMKTIDAFRDHGDPQPRLTHDLAGARESIASLEQLGIDLEAVTQALEDEGIEKFAKPYGRMLEHLASRLEHVVAG